MIVIMTAGKFKQICQEHYSRGVVKGYELGYKTGNAEKSNLGFIIGSKVDEQIEAILRKMGK